ncbi:hypothetical protein JW756_03730 [Candidatus Woesearchaeota archaeon]|nr:hypothetical protein [Candidatus Woesearchaeota archaeon]
MITENDFFLLHELEKRVVEKAGMNGRIDIKPIASELGLNMNRVMKEVKLICDTKKYNVGGHMYCTKHNVLPAYKKNGGLVLDKDHLEGIRRILAVEYKGLCQDY